MSNTPERRLIPGYSRYEVSSDGHIYGLYNRGRGKQRKEELNHRGYYIVLLTADDGKKRDVPVHRAVCIAFHGQPPTPGMHASHKNSVSTDNRAENLSWKTPKENNADKVPLGRTNRGERNGRAKLTITQVLEIRASRQTHVELSRLYGVGLAAISDIRSGKRWKHLEVQA